MEVGKWVLVFKLVCVQLEVYNEVLKQWKWFSFFFFKKGRYVNNCATFIGLDKW